jgi:beta-lactamase regulating signal transducer with metallopeptidase domain
MRISEFILNFVLNSAWQIVVIFVIASLASWLLRNGPARYRHTLWVFAMLASLVVPLLTATRFVPDFQTPIQTNVTQAPRANDFEDLSVNHVSPSRRKTVNLWSRDILLLTFIYALLVCGRGIRLARFWLRQRRLRQSATVAPELEMVARRCRSLLRTCDVSTGLSKQARVPSTIGAFRPLIVLPDTFCAVADEAKLLSVIGHEMAHVKRRDFLSNLICELVALGGRRLARVFVGRVRAEYFRRQDSRRKDR